MKESKKIESFLEAIEFAAYRHRSDKPKYGEPYINHVISVCSLVGVVGEIDDEVTLVAAALHDVLEKSNAKPNELNFQFGEEVYNIVLELTDHHSDADADLFQKQLERASSLSAKARVIKMADKIANVKAILNNPPDDWDMEKKSLYINWAERIVNSLRGTNKKLEEYFDEIIASGIKNKSFIPDGVNAS